MIQIIEIDNSHQPMATPHILVIPYPVMGHIIPLMKLSQTFTKCGFRVTFLNSELYHKRAIDAFTFKCDAQNPIHMVSIPDGMEPHEDRNQFGKLTEASQRVMPVKLEELITEMNKSESDAISCVVADLSVGWALQVAAKMGIKRAAFWPASAALLALCFNIQGLVDDGVIDPEGTPLKHEMVQLSPNMPPMNPAKFVWANMGDLELQKIILEIMKSTTKAMELAQLLICNSNHNLEPAAFDSVPQAIPIGPLCASNEHGPFCDSDSTSSCLKWLDQQDPLSVIYVAFGTLAILDKAQFQELALGLELSDRPFLWVVRPDVTDGVDDAYPEGFLGRVGDRGRIVGWAPQGEVLRHPAVACFVSHCGWNSTMEGVSGGVPFLCWPYFADQFINETYICDVWKVGLGFERGEGGVVMREEIRNKVERLLGDGDVKRRASEMKGVVRSGMEENGRSYENINKFIEWVKA